MEIEARQIKKGCTLNTEKGIVVDLTEPFLARILAHLSEDSLLISTLHTAEDVFSSLAARYNASCDAILSETLCIFNQDCGSGSVFLIRIRIQVLK